MSENAWMCLNKQDFGYAVGPKYAKILNMAKVWICQGSQYASVAFWICHNMPWQIFEYVVGSKYARIVNMAEFLICKCYDFEIVLMFQFNFHYKFGHFALKIPVDIINWKFYFGKCIFWHNLFYFRCFNK